MNMHANVPALLDQWFRQLDERGPTRVVDGEKAAPIPFSSSTLFRSLIRSGIPVEISLEMLPNIVEELDNRGYSQCDISKVELVRTVGATIRGWDHKKAGEWIVTYHNRYGWEHEFAEPAPVSADAVRVTDYVELDKIVSDLIDREYGKAFGNPDGLDTSLRRVVSDSKDQIRRAVTRSVRATRLHTISRKAVETIAIEVSSWMMNPPDWDASRRKDNLANARVALKAAEQTIALNDFDRATEQLASAVLQVVVTLAQGFHLWVGLPSEGDPIATLPRFADRLRLAQSVWKDRKHQPAVSISSEIVDHLQKIGMDTQDLLALLDEVHRGLRSTKSPEGRLNQLRFVYSAVDRLARLATALTDITADCPSLDAFFDEPDAKKRQRILDDIIGYVLRSSGFTPVPQGHSFKLKDGSVPFAPLDDSEVTVHALSDSKHVSVKQIEGRLKASGNGHVIICAPSGFSEEARAHAVKFDQPGRFVFLMDDAILGPVMRVPGEFATLLKRVASEKLVHRPAPQTAPQLLQDSYIASKRSAEAFLPKEALLRLSSDFEAYLRESLRGWCLAVYGPQWPAMITVLLGARGRHGLTMGSCCQLLQLGRFREACVQWARRTTGIDCTSDELFPARTIDVLWEMKSLRNRVAHGGQFFHADYDRFRTFFEHFFEDYPTLLLWPRLVQIRENHGISISLIDPGTDLILAATDASGVAASAATAYAFSPNWTGSSVVSQMQLVPASRYCAQCQGIIDIEDADRECPSCRTMAANTKLRLVEAAPPAPAAPLSSTTSNTDQLRALLDWLEKAFPSNEEFERFCDEYAGVTSDNFQGSLRARWKKLVRYFQSRGEDHQLFGLLRKSRPNLALPDNVQLKRTSGGVRSAWSDDVAGGIKVPRGRRRGVFIGINKYHNAGQPDLTGCVADAEGLRATFMELGRFQKTSQLVTDTTAKGSYRDAIFTAISTTLEGLTAEDLFVISFAGHGIRELDVATGKWRSALLVPSTTSGRCDYVWIDDINDTLRSSRVGSSVRIYDCCFSGQAELRRSGAGAGTGVWLREAAAALTAGHFGIAACAIDQVAREKNGRGYLSGSLEEALRGGTPPSNRPIAIDALKAFSAAVEAVEEMSAEQQTPHYDIGSTGSLVLTAVIADS